MLAEEAPEATYQALRKFFAALTDSSYAAQMA